MKYAVLSSGSCGNSYVFYDGFSSVVVDDGLSFTQFTKRLENAKIPLDSVASIFITHLHPDHINGLHALLNKIDVNVYINEYTAKREPLLLVKSRIPLDNQKYVKESETITINNSFEVYPFTLSHDCIGTLGYRIKSLRENKTFVVITDTGFVPDGTKEIVNDADVVFLESNYDDIMLKDGPYDVRLQNRIRGERGHLSNIQAYEFLKTLTPKKNRIIHLIHVSANNNKVEKIKETLSLLDDSLYSSLVPLNRGEFYEASI